MRIKDNRGLSLVELIVVIGIISVLAGIAMLSISTISGLPARKCANNIHAVLSDVRVTTMGKSSDTLVLKVTDDGVFAVETTNAGLSDERTTEVRVGDNTVKLYVTLDNAGVVTETELTSGSQIQLEFNRSTGALKPCTVGGTDYYTAIRAHKAGKSYTVQIVPFTGKMSVSASTVSGGSV